ncbi:MAG: AAA family ATPase [Acidobacteria bacterium]|nr:AAA family ATPase [Acidobacteriota bacterium]
MRTKVLRGRDDRQTLDALGGSLPAAGNGDSPAAVSQPGHAAYLVPTARQRHLWALPDLAVSGGAVPVDEPRALDLLHDAAAAPGTAAELFPGRFPEAVSGLDAGAPGASWFDAERSFLSPGARVAQAVRALDRAGLPSAVQEALSDRLTRVFGCGARAAEAALDRVRAVLDLPWVKSEPQRFDRTHVEQLLGRTHAALDGAKAGVLRFLGSCPQARDLLTFEGPCSCRRADTTDRLPALVVRPGPVQRQAFVLCLAGGRGTGKTSLARAVAEALGRTPVSVSLDGKATKRQIHGSWRDVASGCVVTGLRQTGVNNPLFILEGLDAVGDADAHTDPLLGVLDPSKRTAFTDAYLGVPLDLSGVLWIATATDAGAIPAAVRDCLHVVDLPAYTEQEKVAIAQEHLLARPFDGPLPTPAGVLAVEPDSAVPVGGAPPSGPAAPVLVADRVVSSVEELRGLPAAATAAGDGAGEPWRTAASRGDVRFEPEAIRRVIRDYTSEPGVKDLKARLADICRQVVLRRTPAARRPDIVTPALVPAFLGDGSADLLPGGRAGGHRDRTRAAVGRFEQQAESLDRVAGEPPMDQAQRRGDRPEAHPAGARCRAGGARGREGAGHRVPGRAQAEPVRHGRRPLFPRLARGGEDVVGAVHRPGPRAPVRPAAVRRTP